jgi:hypothetical protein
MGSTILPLYVKCSYAGLCDFVGLCSCSFHSMTPNGTFEERSMHGACPVIKGTKW